VERDPEVDAFLLPNQRNSPTVGFQHFLGSYCKSQIFFVLEVVQTIGGTVYPV
jgi:hypothetical protein